MAESNQSPSSPAVESYVVADSNIKPYFKGGNTEIFCGDCLEVLKSMGEGVVDAIVTDPPYFLPATHYQTRSRSTKSLSDLTILEHFFEDVWAEARRVLKDDGFLYSFCDGQSYPVYYATAYTKFKKLRPLIWDKKNAYTGYAWRHQHELIMFAKTEEAPAVKTGDGDILRTNCVPIDERTHLAQKPINLLEKLINKTTPEDGIVLDPFMGSGSTVIAAENLGYRAVGVEKDERYCEGAIERLQSPRQSSFAEEATT